MAFSIVEKKLRSWRKERGGKVTTTTEAVFLSFLSSDKAETTRKADARKDERNC